MLVSSLPVTFFLSRAGGVVQRAQPACGRGPHQRGIRGKTLEPVAVNGSWWAWGEKATFEDSWDFRQTGSGARMWTPCILEEGIKLEGVGRAESLAEGRWGARVWQSFARRVGWGGGRVADMAKTCKVGLKHGPVMVAVE